MNCRTCGYPLWNLPGRACPECGAAFLPSEFVFPPGGVRFCCPGCDQQYFGTDPSGHLVPKQFDCVACGARVAMDEMTMRPAGESVAVSAAHVERPEMPWFEREKHGAIRAWFKTVGRAMSAPTSLIKAVPTETSRGDAFLFVLANLTIFFVVGSLPSILISVGMRGRMGGLPGLSGVMESALSVASFVVNLVALVIWCGLTHLILRWIGGASEPSRRTWHALCYASAAGVLMAIPFGCGGVPGMIWWTVAAILMLATVHRCPVGKATAATLLAGFVAMLLPIALTVTMFALSVSSGGRFTMNTRGGPYAVNGAGSAPLAASLRRWTTTHGEWPDHALRLIELQDANSLPATAFSEGSDQVAPGLPEEFVSAASSPEQAKAFVDQAAAALPADVIGHRVGDWMFIYHGMAPGDRGILWTGVLAPRSADPGEESAAAADPAAQAGAADVTFRTIDSNFRATDATFRVLDQNGRALDLPLSAWPGLIQAQNVSRAIEGLPPLPTSYDLWRARDLIVPGG